MGDQHYSQQYQLIGKGCSNKMVILSPYEAQEYVCKKDRRNLIQIRSFQCILRCIWLLTSSIVVFNVDNKGVPYVLQFQKEEGHFSITIWCKYVGAVNNILISLHSIVDVRILYISGCDLSPYLVCTCEYARHCPKRLCNQLHARSMTHIHTIPIDCIRQISLAQSQANSKEQ